MATYAVQAVTANDRLKQRFDTTLALSFILAASLHALAFALWPAMSAPSWGVPDPETIELLRPDEVTIPEAPEPMARPARPVVTTTASVEETLPKIGFDEYVELPPPPQDPTSEGTGKGVPFTPFTVAPQLLNGPAVQRALERVYPPSLRDAGLGGTVDLLIHVSAEGQPLDGRLERTSGYEVLDAAALGLVDMLRFRPAMNRDKYVAVWIRLPLTFQVR